MRRRRARGTGRRPNRFATPELCRGPGNLTRALGISLRAQPARPHERPAANRGSRAPRRDVVAGAAASGLTSGSKPSGVVVRSDSAAVSGRRRSTTCAERDRATAIYRRRVPGAPDACTIGDLDRQSHRPLPQQCRALTVPPIGGIRQQPDELDRDPRCVTPLKLTMMSPGGGRRRRRPSAGRIRDDDQRPACSARRAASAMRVVSGWSSMPLIVPRRTSPYLISSSMTCLARLLGTAKPMPW